MISTLINTLIKTEINTIQLGSLLNQTPPNDDVPVGAIKFEGTDTYVTFENDGYIIFE